MFRGHTLVQIARRVQTGTDSLNDPIFSDTALDLRGELVPIDSTENLDAAEQVTRSFTVYLPAAMPAGIRPVASDRVLVDGDEYELQGDPKPVRILGRLDHYEAVAVRVTG